ncbi:MAG: tyrosine-type recombinase/integrase [Bacillaceae bacterium]
MAIKIQSNFNYKKMCEEAGVDFKAFELLMQTKDPAISLNKVDKQHTVINVIDKFIESLDKEKKMNTKSMNTIKYYKSFLNRFKSFLQEQHKSLLFTNLNHAIFSDFLISTFDSELEAKQSSINTYVAIIKALCSFAVKHDYIHKNMGNRFKKSKIQYLPRYFNNNQITDILTSINQRRLPLLWKTIVITLLGTGLRVSELVKMRIEDIDFTNQLIYTIGKGNKERYIPLYPHVKDSLLHYLKKTGVTDFTIKESLVFSRDAGNARQRRISERSIQYNIKEICNKLGYEMRFTVHSFRHTFAVNCLKAGMDIMYLCQILGHESPSTSAIYTKLLPKDLQQEVQEKFPFPLEQLVYHIIEGEQQ